MRLYRVYTVNILLLFYSLTFGMLCRASDEPGMDGNGQSRDYIEALQVQYVTRGTGSFAPAFVDTAKRLILIWRDVDLQIDKVPNAGEHHRNPVIDLRKTDFTIKEINPYIRYIPKNGVISVGFWDHSAKTFFLWHGLNISKPDAGFETFEQYKIVDEDVRNQIDIPVPARFWSSLFTCKQ
jgi:hypothetical protein